ncbi:MULTISPECIES: bifunctional diguanylate cyclase/phosphodiesterase [unclassified Sphingomonas]|uniref:putative bifunctional diguanylate cyclase/phosphodiesterase n=1 Tax=unclassified Sphingomonas TaxID=196159 RepID=UPI001F56B307|nr:MULTISPECIES: bifunctional diguanylate cyclase/phosphodiesterase [unclassified Sphingomonas]
MTIRDTDTRKTEAQDSRPEPAPRSDLVGNAITVAAILLFVGLGSAALSSTVQQLVGSPVHTDQALVIALLLNIALILIGWRRHSHLANEVSVRTAAEERAQHLAARDPLTGFLNRRSLAEAGAAMASQTTSRRKAMALLLLDLDHFKIVNDLHGHATGDALLMAVAREIADAMPPQALTARLGGDEFACAFTFDPLDPMAVEQVAETLVARLAKPFQADGIHLHISASVGIARSDNATAGFDTLMRSADTAMYAAKNAGRNRFAWFDKTMERERKARSDLEAELRLAIPRGEIVPYFEQQIDLLTGRLCGFEVLARWEHPVRGLLGPDAFVPIAEQTGLISDLSLAIMRQAFQAARDWDAGLTLAVNISPLQLRDAWMAQKIIKVLTETGFPANRLEIEITEATLLDNLTLTQSIVGSLKNQGVRLALDDFGTGFSALSHLRALPFDQIKIDRSLVLSIEQSAESTALVTAISRLCDSLNLQIIAEGIADARIEERLRAVGCAKGQGFLYGQPLSVANTRRLLAERRLLQMPVPGIMAVSDAERRRSA